MSKKPASKGSADDVFASLFAVAFITFWTGGVYKGGGPIFMVAIGAFMLLRMIGILIDNIKTFIRRRNDMQFYGENIDYTEEDPWDKRYTADENNQSDYSRLDDIYQYTSQDGTIYCPYCGVRIAIDFEYCPKCGKKLPF